MSFAGEVREELSQISKSARDCQIAELTAVLSLCGGVTISAKEHVMLRIQTENLFAARKTFMLIRKLFSCSCEVRIRRRASSTYMLAVRDEQTVRKILQTCALMKGENELEAGDDILLTDPGIVKNA